MNKPAWYYLVLLILAGEAVFILPFVLPRIFRPTVLDVFEMTNLNYNLGVAIYGIIAMVSYPFGGPLADRFPPRKLIAVALWLTALGGILYARYPDLDTLKILYGYWGFTTIFLFWAPMIKATRVWGGDTSQGKAFGLLDGGRGLTGALFGVLGVFVFAAFLSSDVQEVTLAERQNAFAYVIYVASAIIVFIGILVWLFMKSNVDETKILVDRITAKELKQVLKLPSVWLLMVIILCSYVGYKITDVISQYANEVMLYDQVKSAQVGTFLQFLRPTTGIVVGLLVDRFRITFWLLSSLVFCVVGGIFFATGVIGPSTTVLFFISVVIIGVGVYAARALYFGVMREGRIPLVLTGTAVGLISLVGYTPDIFAGPAYGYFLDAYPGERGHQYVFWMLTGFSAMGAIAAFIYFKLYNKN
ncbi:MFS transporter [Muricauda sp. SCSIO 64092]|uniref:MFS transporter n=1 Tax=Allomuricauda sp. SCSIO 64092 TaxID=2908842 RepID=UPI001FF10D5D|nr:MFS transporter [Muricauda sp. SCSIO 64092]UOY07086.1 MFS transporter [Muricauda sp. SCSIO 64092]